MTVDRDFPYCFVCSTLYSIFQCNGTERVKTISLLLFILLKILYPTANCSTYERGQRTPIWIPNRKDKNTNTNILFSQYLYYMMSVFIFSPCVHETDVYVHTTQYRVKIIRMYRKRKNDLIYSVWSIIK
jgi:hypothetical protein